MAKTVKVRAYKKLGPTGKVESVDSHMREISSEVKKLARNNASFLLYAKAGKMKTPMPSESEINSLADSLAPKLNKLYGK